MIDCVKFDGKVDEFDCMICCFGVVCDVLWYVVVCLVVNYFECLLF